MKINFIDEGEIKNKKILLRADFNVTLDPQRKIADDFRVKRTLPTIEYLLKNKNQLIILSHLGRPKDIDDKFSLQPLVEKLKEYLPKRKIVFEKNIDEIKNHQEEIVVFENIRFFKEEKEYNDSFAQKLSSLAEIYVNDAFAVCHRENTSVVGPPKYLPSFGGLLLKKEILILDYLLTNPSHPILAIIGGAKISTKIGLLTRLSDIVDTLFIGGALANTFICALGYKIGSSYCELDLVNKAKEIINIYKLKNKKLIIPKDVVIAKSAEDKEGQIVKINEIPDSYSVYDIGEETSAELGSYISKAKTIIWNGPVGYFENPNFSRGTDFIYYSIVDNDQAISVVGGGETVTAVNKKEYLEKITHISTGGGAMLEYIEKNGNLPGLIALSENKRKRSF